MQQSFVRRITICTVAPILFAATGPFQLVAATTGALPGAIPFLQQAAGNPIFDCTGMQATAARLRSGLPLQDQWIRSTEAQLRAAETGIAQSRATLQEMALKSAVDLATGQLKAVADFRTALENARGYSLLKRGQWMNKIAQLEELAQNIDSATKVGGAAVAGRNLGTLMQTNRATLQDFISQIQESGLSDELGLKAAVFAGPAGVLVVQTFMVARDVGFAAAEGVMSATEAAMARENLAQMRAAGENVRSRAYELESIVASDCAPRPASSPDRIQVEPPAEAAPAAAPSTPPGPPAGSGGGGGGVGTAVKVGVAVAGAAVGGLFLKQQLAKIDADTDAFIASLGAPTTSTPTPSGNTTATYRAQVTDTCTPGANGDVLAGQIGTPCSRIVSGPCGAAPTSFTFNVVNGAVRNECWLGDATVSSGTYTGRLLATTCDDKSVSGPLPGTWTMTCTEGKTRPATHRITVVITRQ